MSGSRLFGGVLALLLCISAVSCGGSGRNSVSLRSERYVICADDNGSGAKWAEYLYRHLSKRCEAEEVVLLVLPDDALETDNAGNRIITIRVDQNLDYDYCIENNGGDLTLRAKQDRTMLWLVYQYIALLGGEDERFWVDDIPPAMISFESCCRNFDFEYREPFFSPNLKEDYPGIIGTNSLETDWGIWGHNMGEILDDAGDEEVYALRGDRVDKRQYCFSNEATFRHIREYIVDNYGYEPGMRFVLMPNDNTTVCTCAKCVGLGNTEYTATPAVSFMIERLAGEFPSHMFFTSAYLTTREAPSVEMSENVGVLVSTIDLPKGIDLHGTKQAEEFTNELELWKKATPNIYIWDYAANFDDYLTPLPVLNGLKKQLCFYQQAGVRGIFLNASGYDYSPFDDLKTYVAAALMMDHTLSVGELCSKFLLHFYPVSGSVLAGYYLALERNLENLEVPYNIYGSFREALRTFFDEDEFILLYGSLEPLIAASSGEEKEKLEKLYTAMSFARLQLAYTRGTGKYGFALLEGKRIKLFPAILAAYERLGEHINYTDLTRYKEAEGSLGDYMENWKRLLQRLPDENHLIGEPLEILSPVDPDYTHDTFLLNDGVKGFYYDYHQGWFLSSSEFLHVRFPGTDLGNANTLSLRFLMHERHKIHLPEKIEIFKDDVLYKTATPGNRASARSGINVARTDLDIDVSGAEYVSLKIYKKKDIPDCTIACDEIQLKYNEL